MANLLGILVGSTFTTYPASEPFSPPGLNHHHHCNNLPLGRPSSTLALCVVKLIKTESRSREVVARDQREGEMGDVGQGVPSFSYEDEQVLENWCNQRD